MKRLFPAIFSPQLREYTIQNTRTQSYTRALPVCVITNTHKFEFLLIPFCVLFNFYILYSPDFLFSSYS
jgi:hypothetical protein